MLEISDQAKQKILETMDAKEAQGMALRIVIAGRGPMGFMYQLGFVPSSEALPEDSVLEFDGLTVLVDPASAENLQGASINYLEDEFQSGFQIDNPNPLWREPIAQAVQEVIDTQINPTIMAHRGFVSLLEVKDGVAYIAFGGGCQGCGMADVTLKQGVEVKILEAVPEITQVLDTTDHGGGSNPYFQPGNQGRSPVG
jgi:Fe/S biogenesis protein NfuA